MWSIKLIRMLKYSEVKYHDFDSEIVALNCDAMESVWVQIYNGCIRINLKKKKSFFNVTTTTLASAILNKISQIMIGVLKLSRRELTFRSQKFIETFLKIQSTPAEKSPRFHYEDKQLMLFEKIIVVCSENHTKPIKENVLAKFRVSLTLKQSRRTVVTKVICTYIIHYALSSWPESGFGPTITFFLIVLVITCTRRC
jgi:hypothetical protein